MILLLQDRMVSKPSKPYEKHCFLEARAYPLKRKIKGLGWLVYVNRDPKNPITSVIKFDEGEEIS